MKEIKLYEVVFNTYTGCCYNAVHRNDTEELDYVTIPFGGLIIREDEIEFYMQYGNGFKSLTFVGSLLEKDLEK